MRLYTFKAPRCQSKQEFICNKNECQIAEKKQKRKCLSIERNVTHAISCECDRIVIHNIERPHSVAGQKPKAVRGNDGCEGNKDDDDVVC